MGIFGAVYKKVFHDKNNVYNFDHKEIFELFNQMFISNPDILYWIKALPYDTGRYIILDFFHPYVYRYRLLEFSVVDKDKMCYFWLPGALPGGKGHVRNGKHYVKVNCMREKELTYLCVQKTEKHSLKLLEVSKTEFEKTENFTHLLCNYPHQSFFEELRGICLFWLQWHLQACYCGVMDRSFCGKNQNFKNILKMCENIDEQLWMIAEKILDELQG